MCEGVLRPSRFTTGDGCGFHGSRALNAVELAHAQGRTRDGERGRESKAVQRRDERHEEAMRTEAEDWLMHIHLIVGVTVVNTHGGLFYT